MPTLQPQTLSGLVVTPTVEHVPGIHRVSIGIDVGASRVGAAPPQTVTREDLVVELRGATEGSFEAIASPDPGPLPTRALRVVQARGEFTFAQGATDPDEVKVTLRGASTTFPLSQTVTVSGGLSQVPQVGDAFPRSHRWPFPIRLSLLWPWRRAQCSVKRFEAPLNTVANAPVKSELFEVEADFNDRGKIDRCRCCEYRQFVRGTFTDANAAAVPFDMASGPVDPTVYREDGYADEFGAGKNGFYGHRDTSTPGDLYETTQRPHPDCHYRGNERAGCPPTDTAHLEYVGLVVDRCRGTVVEVLTWAVDL